MTRAVYFHELIFYSDLFGFSNTVTASTMLKSALHFCNKSVKCVMVDSPGLRPFIRLHIFTQVLYA